MQENMPLGVRRGKVLAVLEGWEAEFTNDDGETVHRHRAVVLIVENEAGQVSGRPFVWDERKGWVNPRAEYNNFVGME
jgi:hypothetical protein